MTLSVLVDTNILLDVVLAREPWAGEGARLLDAIAAGRLGGAVASHAITTVFHLVERARDVECARTAVADLLAVLDVVPLDADDFHRALSFDLRDYEDAVQAAACLRAGADCIVTRNPKDFTGAPVSPRSAGAVLASLAPAD